MVYSETNLIYAEDIAKNSRAYSNFLRPLHNPITKTDICNSNYMLEEMINDVVSQPIWIAIVIGVFFVGIGVSYAHFANTYDPMSMKFQNQELFDQMMSNNPRMSQQWMDSDMMNHDMMDSGMMMGSNPIEQHERMLELIGTMTNDENMMNHLFAHMIENERIVHQMFSIMDGSSALKEHMAAHVSGDLSEYEHLDDMHDEEEHGHEEGHQ